MGILFMENGGVSECYTGVWLILGVNTLLSRSGLLQHLLCLVLQALAAIAMNPSYHTSLSDADVPDMLMQLLLPSDEW